MSDIYPGGQNPGFQHTDLYLGSAPGQYFAPSGGAQALAAMRDPGGGASTSAEVNLIGGMVNPSVSEAKPNAGGRRVDAFLLRELGRVKNRLAKLEAAQ